MAKRRRKGESLASFNSQIRGGTTPKPTRQPQPSTRGGNREDLCFADQVQTAYGYQCASSDGYNSYAVDSYCYDTCGGSLDDTFHDGCSDGGFGNCQQDGAAYGTWVDPPNHPDDDYTCHIWGYCKCYGTTCSTGWCAESQPQCPFGCNDYDQLIDSINWDPQDPADLLPEVQGFIDNYCEGDPINCFDNIFKHHIKCRIENFNIDAYLQEYAGDAWGSIAGTDAYVLYDEGGNQVGVDSIEIGVPTVSFDIPDSIQDPIYVNIDIEPLRADLMIRVPDANLTLDEGFVGTAPNSPFMMELKFTPVFVNVLGEDILDDYIVTVDMNFWFFMFYSGLADALCDCDTYTWGPFSGDCNWTGDFVCCAGCALGMTSALIEILASLALNYFTADAFKLIINETMGEGMALDLNLAPIFVAIMSSHQNCLLGDLNGDGGWNVLDIVTLAECVLAQNCGGMADPVPCAGDLNGSGGWNVLDIVTLAHCVLANNCGADANGDPGLDLLQGAYDPPPGLDKVTQNSIIKEVLVIAEQANGSNDKQVEREIADMLERKVPIHIKGSGRTTERSRGRKGRHRK